MQSKLLRAVQEGEIRSLGSNRFRKVDVRIISASSNSLRDLVESQKFREDLYYRLHVYPIRVPTLSERHEDIPLLANYFLKKFSRQQKKKAKSFHRSLLSFMKSRIWSGNIRELENFVERLVTISSPEMGVLDREILPQEFYEKFNEPMMGQRRYPDHKSLQQDLNEYEEKIIRNVLEECDWNKSKAARVLRISERTIRYKITKLKIKRLQ